MTMREGAEVYRELKDHADAARGRAAAVGGELAEIEQRLRDVVARRVDAVQRLARHYLPALEDQTIERAASEVRGELRAVQSEQQAEVARLRAEVADAARTLAAREDELETVTARLDACVRRRTELEQEAAARLQTEPGFAELATRAADTERKLERDEQRSLEMAREAAAKLPAYERSKLFQYLVRRKYGTAEYAASGLVRRLDRWVARLIGYERARQGYDFLRVTPQLVAAEVERRRAEFAPLLDELKAREQRVEEQVGLPPVLAEGEQLGVERDRLVAAVTAAQQEHRTASEQLAGAESSQGKYHGAALAKLSAALDGTQTRALERHAQSTPEQQDDALVGEIARVRREQDELSERLRDLAEQRTALERTAARLERLVRRFREANFDATRSRVAAVDVAGLVERVRSGTADVDDAWRELQRSQRFVQPAGSSGWIDDDGDLSTTSRVLISAMGHVLGAALHGAVRRSVARGGGLPRIKVGGGGGFGGSRRGGGGFSRGGGFGGGRGGFSRGGGF